MTGALQIQLTDSRSLPALRWSLERALEAITAMAAMAERTATRELARKRASDAQRHERRAAEYRKRADIIQQLIDQLPTDTAPMTAPTGD